MKDVTSKSDFPGNLRNGTLDFGWDTSDEDTKLSKSAIDFKDLRLILLLLRRFSVVSHHCHPDLSDPY